MPDLLLAAPPEIAGLQLPTRGVEVGSDRGDDLVLARRAERVVEARLKLQSIN